jgi:AraC family transcriptional regulator
MVSSASNLDESCLNPQEGINHTSVGIVQTGADLRKPIVRIGFNPIVKITPSEPVKRLGTGWKWWFSESVHVPIGSKI